MDNDLCYNREALEEYYHDNADKGAEFQVFFALNASILAGTAYWAELITPAGLDPSGHGGAFAVGFVSGLVGVMDLNKRLTNDNDSNYRRRDYYDYDDFDDYQSTQFDFRRGGNNPYNSPQAISHTSHRRQVGRL